MGRENRAQAKVPALKDESLRTEMWSVQANAFAQFLSSMWLQLRKQAVVYHAISKVLPFAFPTQLKQMEAKWVTSHK